MLWHDSREVVVVPVDEIAGRFAFAIASCRYEEGDLLKSLAREFANRRRLEKKFDQVDEMVAELSETNDSLVVQVTEDFEELTFLRSMAEYVECSDESFDHLQLARIMLPPLARSVRSEAMILVSAGANESSGFSSKPEKLEVWVGKQMLSEEESVQIVSKLAPLCEYQPYVNNRLVRTPLGVEFPGIHSLLALKLASSRQTLGWLVALNRISLGNLDFHSGHEELSHLEFGTSEATLLGSAASILAAHASNIFLLKQKAQLLTNVIRALVSAIEAKDEYTRGHSDRVALYARRLSKQVGYSDKDAERIYLSGLLHDVGKIGVSDSTLRKPGKLTDAEYEEMKKHPDEGWSILCDLVQLRDTLPGVLYHHERFDGKGYPDGLVGEGIPLDGRIMAVVDSYDAMTSDRPYRSGMPQEKAEMILREGAGTQWDPYIVNQFFEAMPDIIEIKNSYTRPEKAARKFGSV